MPMFLSYRYIMCSKKRTVMQITQVSFSLFRVHKIHGKDFSILMRILTLPSNQMFDYVFTGKFKAPTADWKHEHFYLAEYELFVMTEGTLYLSYNQENFTVNSGEYLLLPPCNSWRQGFKSAYSSFYWLHFATPPLTESTSEVFTLPQQGNIPKLEKMVVLMKQLQDEVKNHYPTLALNAMTTSVITELYGQLYLNAPVNTKTSNQKQIYSDIIDYIQLNLHRNIKISEIAAHFGYNEKYLSHLFADITGVPLKQFILSRKMDSANFMLTDTNKPISDIAKELGFSDNHNFSRAYKSFTGLTPSEYRNAFSKRMLFHK